MTDEERMSFWKGGDSKDVLRFTNPYDYKDCIIGVSTDGRAVYDYNKVLDFIYEQDKGSYNVKDFENEEDMEYNIYQNAADMLNHDLKCYRPDAKVPVFCKIGECEKDEEYMIHVEYDFSDCVLGSDFREDRYIFSLSKMVDVLTKKHRFTKKDAVKYAYSFGKAGTVDRGVYFYVIVDDLFEKIDVDSSELRANPKYSPELERIFRRYNDKYSPDFEKNSLVFNGAELVSALKKADVTFPPLGHEPMKDYVHCACIKKEDDKTASLSGTNGQVLFKTAVNLKTESTLEKPLYIPDPFVNFLTLKIKPESTVRIFEGNCDGTNAVYIKILEVKQMELEFEPTETQKQDNCDGQLFSFFSKDVKFPDFSKLFQLEYPFKAEVKRSILCDLWNWILENDDNSDEAKFTFSDKTLTLEYEGFKKTESSDSDLKETFAFNLNPGCVNLLKNYFEKDFTVSLIEPGKAAKIESENTICVFMTNKNS